MLARPLILLTTLGLLLALASPAGAVELKTGKVDVTFHISHPAKEYDAFLLPDGGHGVIQITPEAIEKTTAEFVMKVNHFDSDNTRRDSHMLEVLEGFIYPTINWSVTSVRGAEGPWSPGVTRFTAEGPLTVHGVSRDVSIPVEIIVGALGELSFGAQFTILLEEYGIERPTLVFVPIDNELPIIVKVDTKPNPNVLPSSKAPEAAPAAEGSEADSTPTTEGGEANPASTGDPTEPNGGPTDASEPNTKETGDDQ